MKTNYTKCEWYAVNIAGHYVIQDEDNYNGTVLFDEFECEEAEYNAKLAAAAPDLLTELINILPYINNFPKFQQQSIKQAIKKATE